MSVFQKAVMTMLVLSCLILTAHILTIRHRLDVLEQKVAKSSRSAMDLGILHEARLNSLERVIGFDEEWVKIEVAAICVKLLIQDETAMYNPTRGGENLNE